MDKPDASATGSSIDLSIEGTGPSITSAQRHLQRHNFMAWYTLGRQPTPADLAKPAARRAHHEAAAWDDNELRLSCVLRLQYATSREFQFLRLCVWGAAYTCLVVLAVQSSEHLGDADEVSFGAKTGLRVSIACTALAGMMLVIFVATSVSLVLRGAAWPEGRHRLTLLSIAELALFTVEVAMWLASAVYVDSDRCRWFRPFTFASYYTRRSINNLIYALWILHIRALVVWRTAEQDYQRRAGQRPPRCTITGRLVCAARAGVGISPGVSGMTTAGSQDGWQMAMEEGSAGGVGSVHSVGLCSPSFEAVHASVTTKSPHKEVMPPQQDEGPLTKGQGPGSNDQSSDFDDDASPAAAEAEEFACEGGCIEAAAAAAVAAAKGPPAESSDTDAGGDTRAEHGDVDQAAARPPPPKMTPRPSVGALLGNVAGGNDIIMLHAPVLVFLWPAVVLAVAGQASIIAGAMAYHHTYSKARGAPAMKLCTHRGSLCSTAVDSIQIWDVVTAIIWVAMFLTYFVQGLRARAWLAERSYQKFRILNFRVRFEMQMRGMGFAVIAIMWLMATFIDRPFCAVSVQRLVGVWEILLVQTIVHTAMAWLLMPSPYNHHNRLQKEWLQQFALTDADRPVIWAHRLASMSIGSKARQEVVSEPIFSMECALKMCYFSKAVYEVSTAGLCPLSAAPMTRSMLRCVLRANTPKGVREGGGAPAGPLASRQAGHQRTGGGGNSVVEQPDGTLIVPDEATAAQAATAAAALDMLDGRYRDEGSGCGKVHVAVAKGPTEDEGGGEPGNVAAASHTGSGADAAPPAPPSTAVNAASTGSCSRPAHITVTIADGDGTSVDGVEEPSRADDHPDHGASAFRPGRAMRAGGPPLTSALRVYEGIVSAAQRAKHAAMTVGGRAALGATGAGGAATLEAMDLALSGVSEAGEAPALNQPTERSGDASGRPSHWSLRSITNLMSMQPGRMRRSSESQVPRSSMLSARTGSARIKSGTKNKPPEMTLQALLDVCGLDEQRVMWEPSTDTLAIVAWSHSTGRACVCFRGTASLANAKSDLGGVQVRHHRHAGPYIPFVTPLVHYGFQHAWLAKGFRERVMAWAMGFAAEMRSRGIRFKIMVTGHSLGGALAHIAAYDMAESLRLLSCQIACYTFGAPRVGDHVFAARYNRVLKDSWNIANQYDAVPLTLKYFVLPYKVMVYKQPGKKVLLARRGDIVVRPSMQEVSLLQVPLRRQIAPHLCDSYLLALLNVLEGQAVGSAKRLDTAAHFQGFAWLDGIRNAVGQPLQSSEIG